MAATINTNLMSLNAQKNLSRSKSDLRTSLERLSSGLRINSARDDAAGLAIASRMTGQIRGMNQAMRNASDGISLGQVAESALVEITNSLHRVRELAIQSANDTNSSSDRQALQKEVTQLQEEMDRIITTSEFNGRALFNSSAASYASSMTFQVGANDGPNYRIVISSVPLNTQTDMTQITSAATITTMSGAQSAIGQVDAALQLVNETRATFGAVQNRFGSVIANLQNNVEALSAARSRIQDADFAAETSNLTRAQILQQAGTAMLSQANQVPQNVLQLLG